jgi:hypothetical protein
MLVQRPAVGYVGWEDQLKEPKVRKIASRGDVAKELRNGEVSVRVGDLVTSGVWGLPGP